MSKDKSKLKLLERIRNIGTIAHIDAGKTTTTERMLFYSGKEHKLGNVDEGTTAMDWLREEQERGITITAAATRIEWKDTIFNLIDTPGHVDFTIEVERSLRVLDGAIGIFCGVGGVEAQSETVWRQADRYRVPRLAFINKLDRLGADFCRCVESIRERLHAKPVPLQMPDAVEASFRGVFDLVWKKYYRYGEGDGAEFETLDIPEGRAAEFSRARAEMIETLSREDDELCEKYLENESALSGGDIAAAVKRLTVSGRITPVLAGSALRNKGVQMLMDAIAAYLPSPLEAPEVEARRLKDGAVARFRCDPAGPLCCLVFKLWAESYGFLYYLRIYSGTLRPGMTVYNPGRRKKERISRLLRMHANDREDLEEALAGDIVAATGPKETYTGDTFCDTEGVLLEKMQFATTVVSQVVEPKSSSDREKLQQAIERIAREDPSFEWKEDPDTGQFVISGMGELHLEVSRHRMLDYFHVDANIGKLRVSYREAPTRQARERCNYRHVIGGVEHAAEMELEIIPRKEELGVRFSSALPPSALKEELLEAIRDTALACAATGSIAGYPLIHLEVRLLGAGEDPNRSTAIAFAHACGAAFQRALEKAEPSILEPIMRLEVVAPETSIGAVIRDLGARRCEICEMGQRGELRTVTAKAPLAELFGYADQVRSLSQGRATFTMEPDCYAKVSPEVMKKIRG